MMIYETRQQFTPKGALKRHTIKQVCQRIKHSWRRARKDIIIKFFNKCSISNALYVTEDQLIYEEDNGDLEEEEEESSDYDFQRFSKIFKACLIL